MVNPYLDHSNGNAADANNSHRPSNVPRQQGSAIPYVMGVLCIIVALIGLHDQLVNLIENGPYAFGPLLHWLEGRLFTVLDKTATMLNEVAAGCLLFAGIYLLKFKQLGRRWFLIYAVLAILSALLAVLVLLGASGLDAVLAETRQIMWLVILPIGGMLVLSMPSIKCCLH